MLLPGDVLYIINETVTTDQEHEDQFKFECQKEILVRNQNQLILAHMHFQHIKFSLVNWISCILNDLQKG